MNELITIPMSHYCEKVRWALDRLGIVYREDRHLQIFHYAHALWWGRTVYVPVLVTPGGVIADSTRILQHLDRSAPEALRLYPDAQGPRAEVEALEERFDEDLGVQTRRWAYYEGLNGFTARQMIDLAAQGVSDVERHLFGALLPAAKWFLFQRLRITRDRVEADRVDIGRTLADVAARLADGRPFLTGDRFTAADLTFASLAAPLVVPREYGIRLPTPEELPPGMRAQVEDYRATAAGRFALRLFETERHAPTGRS